MKPKRPASNLSRPATSIVLLTSLALWGCTTNNIQSFQSLNLLLKTSLVPRLRGEPGNEASIAVLPNYRLVANTVGLVACGQWAHFENPSDFELTACLGQTYRIAGNFHELVKNTIFTFVDCSLVPCQRTPHPQILRKKVSQIATKLRNLLNFFLSRKFPAIWYWSRSILIFLEWHTTPPPYLHCTAHHSDLSFSPECFLSTLHGLLTGSPCTSSRPETFWRPRPKQSLVYTTVY